MLIEAKQISVRHGSLAAIERVDFGIKRGEIVTLIGPNGSGKSSLVRALLGAIPVSNGAVVHAPKLKIGYVPQKLSIDASMPLTVSRFLNLPTRSESAKIVRTAERTGIASLLDRQLGSLSGGQFQRTLLARAILNEPDILILDEATQGLDQPGTAGFYQLLEDLRAELNCAILLVSHDLHVVMSASDRVICMNGHICCEGAPQVVLNAPEYRALFGAGTAGTMALYRHEHDHSHADDHCHHDHEDA